MVNETFAELVADLETEIEKLELSAAAFRHAGETSDMDLAATAGIDTLTATKDAIGIILALYAGNYMDPDLFRIWFGELVERW